MHKFLRAIGFASVTRKKQLRELISYTIQKATEKNYTSGSDEDSMFAEYSLYFGERIGITVRGEYDENNNFTFEYYFPFLSAETLSSEEDLSIERHAAGDSYAGICDDVKVGVSLIFYVQNVIPYVRAMNSNLLPIKGTSLNMSALAMSGMILLPVDKTEAQKVYVNKLVSDRRALLSKARKGDEDAIESLTLDDMDTYTNISKKIKTQDVYTIVDTCFMPYGVECDQYSVIGEILECRVDTNTITSEQVYVMQLDCNNLIFDVCINALDLIGEPAVGRRFKGVIWLQGHINYPG